MNIEPLGRLLFLVHGQEGNYHVDLECNPPDGQCDCPHYRCRLAKLVEAGESGDRIRCKHIRAVRELICNQVIDKVINQ